MATKLKVLSEDPAIVLKNRKSRENYADHPDANPVMLEAIYKKDDHPATIKAIVSNLKTPDRLIVEIYERTFDSAIAEDSVEFIYAFFQSLGDRDEIPIAIKKSILEDERCPEFLYDYWSSELITDEEAAEAIGKSNYFLEHFLINAQIGNRFLTQKIFEQYISLKSEVLNHFTVDQIFEKTKDLNFPSLELFVPDGEDLPLLEQVENLCVIAFAIRNSEFLSQEQIEDIENTFKFDLINEFGDFDNSNKWEVIDINSSQGVEYMNGLLEQFMDSVNKLQIPDSELLDHLWDVFDATQENLQSQSHEVLRAFSSQFLESLSSKEVRQIAKDPSVFVRFSASQREEFDEKLFGVLIADTSEIVRYGVAINPSTSQDVISTLVRDGHPLVRIGTYRRGRLKAAELLELVNDDVLAVRKEITEIDSDFIIEYMSQNQLGELIPHFNDHSLINILESAIDKFKLQISPVLFEVFRQLPGKHLLLNSNTIVQQLPKEFMIFLAGYPVISVRKKVREKTFDENRIDGQSDQERVRRPVDGDNDGDNDSINVSALDKLYLDSGISTFKKAIIAAGTSRKNIWNDAAKSSDEILKLGALFNWKFGHSLQSKIVNYHELIEKYRALLVLKEESITEEKRTRSRSQSNEDQRMERLDRLEDGGDLLTNLFEEYSQRGGSVWGHLSQEIDPNIVASYAMEYVLGAIEDLGLNLEVNDEEFISKWNLFSKNRNVDPYSKDFWGGQIPQIP